MKTPALSSLAVVSALAGSALVPAYGSLLVEESFNYTLDANLGTQAATGTGLTGNWQRGFTDTASAILRTYEATWTAPTGYGYTASGKRIGTPGDQNNSAAVNLASAAQINFDQNGVYYYSYLLKYTNGDDRSRVSFGGSTAVDLMRVQGIADGTLRAYAGATFSAGAALGAGDFLVVGRITTVATGDDENRIWVYSSGDTLASTEETAGAAYTSALASVAGTASMLQFSNLINASYGEFRLGTTWDSVTVSSIPEPSTFAALAGLGVMGLALARRRR